jgi:HPt (histidine-containing phosphotransfer) domain-containing protein
MADEKYAVKVPKDLEDLIPMFMSNRKKEIENLKAALAASNYEEMRQIGHRMKGSGRSYGFATITEIGKRIEDGARGSDGAALAVCLDEYVDYLDKVVITYE